MVWFVLLIISSIARSHDKHMRCASKTSTECNIICDEITDCRNKILDCNADGTGLDCIVDCAQGCINVTIHAENSSHLYINNCDHNNNHYEVYCNNMDIFCPQQINTNINNPICIIQGKSDESYIKSANIFTKQGFTDFQLRNINAINSTMYCGDTASEHWCTINNNGACGIAADTTCNSLLLSTAKPKSIIIAIESLEATLKPTIAMKHKELKEGEVEVLSTTVEIEDNIIEYTIIRLESSDDIDLEIVILSGICLLLLMCCIMFCTLWLTKKYQSYKHKIKHKQEAQNALKLSDLNIDRHKDKHVYVEREQSQIQYGRPQRGSIFADNLSVITMSYGGGMQSPSMRQSFNGIIMSPFNSKMVSVCNSALASDWEDEIDAFNAGLNLKPGEFVVGGEDDDDIYYDDETPPGTDRKATKV